MNCEKCQDLLSDFLDNALSPEDHSTLSVHLEECLSCFAVRDELNSIVSFCRDCREEYVAPPNEHALWLRIRNTVESERTAVAASAQRADLAGRESEGWWSRLMGRSWQLSLPQMTAAVAAITVSVALITALSLQRVQNGTDSSNPASTRAGVTDRTGAPSTVDASSRMSASNVDDRMRQQRLAIEYWNQRVEQRKAYWNQQMREAFERNMNVIDQAVNYSRDELNRNPHDEVSEEMLNSALNDKMELLREFADL